MDPKSQPIVNILAAVGVPLAHERGMQRMKVAPVDIKLKNGGIQGRRVLALYQEQRRCSTDALE
jgi:hypothetical protein